MLAFALNKKYSEQLCKKPHSNGYFHSLFGNGGMEAQREREHQSWQIRIYRFDTNGNGKISVTELDSILRSLGSAVLADELQRVMEDIDTDRDGFINLAEFAAFCQSGSADCDAPELRGAFDLYDKDKNGPISATELCQVLNTLGMKCFVDECHTMIKTIDYDGDSTVNYEEFKMMSNNRPSGN
ncbi:hypothetical protein KIW84_042017 [Lathyrus oleraceus]|uniref:EF-hand domain-containing protein n=1 Tax=Pisum sativum TaxID=3888 RepID=A0A9D5ASU1_PEA|nr:hypothetical protein KIW84_042017 [Pisum sativum]